LDLFHSLLQELVLKDLLSERLDPLVPEQHLHLEPDYLLEERFAEWLRLLPV
jgi:hypothetical protein